MLCVIAKLDEASTAKLQKLQDTAVELGAAPRPVHGHITLVTYVGDDEAEYMAHCRRALRSFRGFPVNYRDVQLWPGADMISAIPEKAGKLQKLHEALAEGRRDVLSEWSQEENWEPHTTLVYGPKLALTEICAGVREQFEPFTAQVTGIEFSRVTEDRYQILDTVEDPWQLYILLCGDGTLYTGITNDLPHRLEMHRSGRGAKYTRGRGPLELVYREDCESWSQALKREHQVKQLPRREKLDLIENYQKNQRVP